MQLRPDMLLALAILVAALAVGVLGRLVGGTARTRLWYWSHTLLGVSVCVFGVALLMWEIRTPMLEAFVVIEQVGIQTTGRGSEMTHLIVRLPSGEKATLAASGRNEFFRPGQHMHTRYQELTGMIDWASFQSSSGGVQAEYRSHIWVAPYVLFGLGVVQIASARWRFVQSKRIYMRGRTGAVR